MADAEWKSTKGVANDEVFGWRPLVRLCVRRSYYLAVCVMRWIAAVGNVVEQNETHPSVPLHFSLYSFIFILSFFHWCAPFFLLSKRRWRPWWDEMRWEIWPVPPCLFSSSWNTENVGPGKRQDNWWDGFRHLPESIFTFPSSSDLSIASISGSGKVKPEASSSFVVVIIIIIR